MAEIFTYNLNLDLSTHPINSITIKQYGKNTYNLNISVTQKGAVYIIDSASYRAYLKMKTPDKRYIYILCDIDENGLVTCTLPESAAWANGVGEAEIEVIKNDGTVRMSTCSFEVVIDPSVYPEEEITGSNDFSALVNYVSQAGQMDQQIQEAKGYKEDAEDASTEAQQAKNLAQIAKTDAETAANQASTSLLQLEENMATAITAATAEATAQASSAVASATSAENSAIDAANSASNATNNAQQVSNLLATAMAMYNGPLTASNVSQMTDHTKVYVFTGTDVAGMNKGDWYYWDNSVTAWVSGGQYLAGEITVDDTLTQTGQAADAKAVGDEITSIKSDLNVNTVDVIEPEYLLPGNPHGSHAAHEMVYNSGLFSIVHKVSANKIYKFVSETARARFYTACFTDKPLLGSVPIENTFIKNDGKTEFTISTPTGTNYLVTYFYNGALDTVTLEEAIRQLTVYEVTSIDSEKVLDALIYGAGSYDIRSDSGTKTAVYRVLPNTTYVLKNKTPRPRFSLACYASEPVIGSTPIANTYVTKHGQNATEITFTTPSTAYYMATYFYNGILDTKTADEVLADMSLVNTATDKKTTDDIVNVSLDKIGGNYKELNFISAESALTPEYLLDALLNGAGAHQINSDTHAKIAVYQVEPGRTYHVKSSKMRVRFSCGIFNTNPVLNAEPVVYEAHHGEKEFYITMPNSGSRYLAIWFFSDWFDTGTYQTALSEMTVSGITRDSLLGVIKYVNNKADEYKADKEQAKSAFNICSWNIGHFSMGRHVDTDITDADYVTKLKAFCDMVRTGEPQLFVLSEYSPVFAALTRGNVLAEDVLFGSYKTKQIGEQRHYCCNAMFSNIPVRNLSYHDYASMADETITDSRPVAAQDAYWIQWDMVFNGVDIHCISTHCVFDTNRPDVLQQKQLQEIFDACDGYDNVILAGDFNTSDFSIFQNAGYDMVQNSGLPFLTGIDNIITKGVSLTTKMRVPNSNTLSDHYAIFAQITVTVE